MPGIVVRAVGLVTSGLGCVRAFESPQGRLSFQPPFLLQMPTSECPRPSFSRRPTQSAIPGGHVRHTQPGRPPSRSALRPGVSPTSAFSLVAVAAGILPLASHDAGDTLPGDPCPACATLSQSAPPCQRSAGDDDNYPAGPFPFGGLCDAFRIGYHPGNGYR